MTPRIGCVVLTQDKRPWELKRAVDSLLDQRGVHTDIVVVGNGTKPEGMPDEVRVLALPENVGIPAGRNAGIGEVTGDLVFFLDDDAHLEGQDFLRHAAAKFEQDGMLGLLQPRVRDPDGGYTPRRFVPRLRVGDPTRSSNIATLWEGSCLVRRAALDKAGSWPEPFFYMHEGIDLAWRVMDAGYSVRYSADLVTYHPSVAPERHREGRYFSARNRVWLARRNLPGVFAVLYVLTWLLIDTLRLREIATARRQLRGYYDGLRLPCGGRSPMSWHTVWRMIRLGRPPVI